MKNLVFNALAFKEGFKTSTQIINKNQSVEIYIKNSFVSLKSCKEKNPNLDVCLFTNRKLPQVYEKIFNENNIKVIEIEFDEFVLSKECLWSLAFFKLKAIKYAINNMSYDNYLMIDTDTYIVGKLDDLWEECKTSILLYELDHRISHPHRKQIYESFELYEKENAKIEHYGGEFICGNKEDLQKFINIVSEEFNNMINKINFDKTLGDEYLISIAVYKLNKRIIRANKYMYRYWTGLFYLVSSNYKNNSIDIWHLPIEKELGMIWLYKYYIKKGKFPQKDVVARRMGFCRSKPTNLKIARIVFMKVKKIIVASLTSFSSIREYAKQGRNR